MLNVRQHSLYFTVTTGCTVTDRDSSTQASGVGVVDKEDQWRVKCIESAEFLNSLTDYTLAATKVAMPKRFWILHGVDW
jgi:hypothetical protein